MIDKINNSEQVISNLKYLGIDEGNIPNNIKDFEPLKFKPLKMYDERKYMIYKYLRISDIQILLTPTDRITPLSEKYAKASALFTYLDSENEENIEKHVTFLKMVKNINMSKLEEIEKEQKEFENKIPFSVKYKNNYLWQIYCQEGTNKYFMLVPTEETENEAFFYLLKKKLEDSKDYIYVPISHQDYTGEFLTSSEIIDLENYLWLFTKDWPAIYEVYDSGENMKLVIVGRTLVYDKIKSEYKIEFKNKQEAITFFKLVKALFIIKTNIESEYDFNVKINDEGALDFFYNYKKIEYEGLSNYIKEEVKKKITKINELNKKNYEIGIILEKQKRNAEEQNTEYLYKQNQLIIYLDCKKSFFGKVSYFFKNKGKGKKYVAKKRKSNDKVNKVELAIQRDEDFTFENKKMYTIEDLIQISKELKKRVTKNKNLELDRKAIETKIEMIENKLINIEQYIKEIEKHKKNIWDFLKFVNKDDNKGLTEGIFNEKIEKEKIQKVFEFDEDIEDFGRQMDDIQRQKLSREEADAIFILVNELAENKNQLDDLNQDYVQKRLEELKNEYQGDIENIEKKDFDIFGAMSDDRSKIKVLKNRRHREVKKNKYKLLNIKPETQEQEYINTLNKYKALLDSAFRKIETPYSICAYKEGMVESKIQVFDLNQREIINKLHKEGEIELTKIRIPENTNVIFCTNIIYYDNLNKTLPLGANVSTEMIIDLSKHKLNKTKQVEFNMNFRIDLFNCETRKIKVTEYEVND
ncbi:MAG: hypothetical protein Q4G05_05845 [Clostridia bacterium]|nr:hypothetical protein [Clostridia bacterium]